MDPHTQNKFATYLQTRSRPEIAQFYLRAQVSSNYFWKLKQGRKNPSPDLIVRLALATEGECLPSEVFLYFDGLKQFRDVDVLLKLLERQWVDETVFAQSLSRFDLEERIADLIEQGYRIQIRKKDGRSEYLLCE